MSAPSIPNLNSLRRGGPRLRGSRGRGTPGGPTTDTPSSHNTGTRIANPPAHAAIQDRIILSTDNDAATSRLSAVATGYLDDPFAALLHADLRSGTASSTNANTAANPPRRLPLMNRGTYARTVGVDRVVDTFLAQHKGGRCQIVSLGAGSDTRFFRLRRRLHQQQRQRESHGGSADDGGLLGEGMLYHEFDLAQNTKSKVARLRRKEFQEAARQECGMDWNPAVSTRNSDNDTADTDDATSLNADEHGYTLSPLDLRSLPPPPPPPSTTHSNTTTTTPPLPITLAQINRTLPTLLISECCLCYLPPSAADVVLSFFSALFVPDVPLAIVIYEPIRPHDAFGRTMVANLAGRGISLPTLERYGELEAQRERLARFGFGDGTEEGGEEGGGGEGKGAGARAVDLEYVWRAWVAAEEKERVEALEWMDEVEEFVLLGRHYAVAFGWRAYANDGEHGKAEGEGEGDAAWRNLPVPPTKH